MKNPPEAIGKSASGEICHRSLAPWRKLPSEPARKNTVPSTSSASIDHTNHQRVPIHHRNIVNMVSSPITLFSPPWFPVQRAHDCCTGGGNGRRDRVLYAMSGKGRRSLDVGGERRGGMAVHTMVFEEIIYYKMADWWLVGGADVFAKAGLGRGGNIYLSGERCTPIDLLCMTSCSSSLLLRF